MTTGGAVSATRDGVAADAPGGGALSAEDLAISATRDGVAADAPGGGALSPQGLAIAIATKTTAAADMSASRCDSSRRRTRARVGPLVGSPSVSVRAGACSSFIEAQDRLIGLRVKSRSGTVRPHSRALLRNRWPCLDSCSPCRVGLVGRPKASARKWPRHNSDGHCRRKRTRISHNNRQLHRSAVHARNPVGFTAYRPAAPKACALATTPHPERGQSYGERR